MSTNSDSERDPSTPSSAGVEPQSVEPPSFESPGVETPGVERPAEATVPVPNAEPSAEPNAEPSTVPSTVPNAVPMAAPAEVEPNPYVVRTTVPPMNPHTTGAPLASQHEPTRPVSAPPVSAPNGAAYPASSNGLPGGEIYSAAPVPVSVAAHHPPVKKGNRLFGTMIALLGTLAFALVYAGVAALFFIFNPSVDDAARTLVRFLSNLAFITPVAFFAIAFILLVVIVNRAGWWAFILGGFFVAAIVYAGAIVGAYLSVSGWQLSPDDLSAFLRSLLMDPLPLTAAVVAREVSVWTGAWVASRGRKLKARNLTARNEFDKMREDNTNMTANTTHAGSPAW